MTGSFEPHIRVVIVSKGLEPPAQCHPRLQGSACSSCRASERGQDGGKGIWTRGLVLPWTLPRAACGQRA